MKRELTCYKQDGIFWRVINKKMNGIIVLTGGTGWVGRNFISEIQKRISLEEFQERVLIFGSKKGEIISNGFKDERIFCYGAFTITNVEHSINQMMWTTSIEGQFRPSQ